jgi:hypothetical protein
VVCVFVTPYILIADTDILEEPVAFIVRCGSVYFEELVQL